MEAIYRSAKEGNRLSWKNFLPQIYSGEHYLKKADGLIIVYEQQTLVMENDKKRNSEPNAQNTNEDFNPANRDFQRTEEDIDSVSQSEKDAIEERNERTSKANTKPDEDKIN